MTTGTVKIFECGTVNNFLIVLVDLYRYNKCNLVIGQLKSKPLGVNSI